MSWGRWSEFYPRPFINSNPVAGWRSSAFIHWKIELSNNILSAKRKIVSARQSSPSAYVNIKQL